MKFRAVTMGIVKEVGKTDGRPLQSFSESMEVINAWAEEVSKQHKVDVKIYQTYERVLAIVKKPYEKPENPPGCHCADRVYCQIHGGKGWLKGRKA